MADPYLLDYYLGELARSHPGYTFGADRGRVYARIWKRLGGQANKSAVAFVGPDGTIYRADSWRQRGRALGTLTDANLPFSRDRARRWRR